MAGGRQLGVVGELAPEIAARYDFRTRVAVFLVDLAPLLEAKRQSQQARPVSRYPAVDLDVAFVAGDDVPAGELGATVQDAAGELAEAVALFDVARSFARRGPPQSRIPRQVAGARPDLDGTGRGGSA